MEADKNAEYNITYMQPPSGGFFMTDQEVLARTIWGEARGEGKWGMEAVASVILNRAKRGGWFGDTITEVCRKPMQFSCWNPNDPNCEKAANITEIDKQYAQALLIAEKAVAGTLPDSTGGATHYHDYKIKPKWSGEMTRTTQIGNHIFYKE